MIPKYKGTREFMLHRNEDGFGDKTTCMEFRCIYVQGANESFRRRMENSR